MEVRTVVRHSVHGRSRRRILLRMGLGAVALLIMLLLLASPALAPTPSFPDVPSTHPYYAAISDLAGRAIITGYEDGTFRPDTLVWRQQFAKMIVLALGLPCSEADICPFSDVEVSGPGSFYPDNYIAVCFSHHITTGFSPITYAPDEVITRTQIITMVVRAALASEATLSTPPDGYQGTLGDFDPTHAGNMKIAEYNDLLAGLQGFGPAWDPFAYASRGEVAQILYTLIPMLPQSATTTTTWPTTTTTHPATTTTTRPPTTTTTTQPSASPYTGSGDDVVTIAKAPGPAVVFIQGNASSGYFGVTAYGAQGDYLDLLVNTTDPYQGIRPLDFEGNQTKRLEVKATGDWAIEIRPLGSILSVSIPGAIAGNGDLVFRVTGPASTAHIGGNAGSDYFGMIAYDLDGDYQDLLVNTTDPYTGTVMLSAPCLVEVRATGSWSFTPQP